MRLMLALIAGVILFSMLRDQADHAAQATAELADLRSEVAAIGHAKAAAAAQDRDALAAATTQSTAALAELDQRLSSRIDALAQSLAAIASEVKLLTATKATCPNVEELESRVKALEAARAECPAEPTARKTTATHATKPLDAALADGRNVILIFRQANCPPCARLESALANGLRSQLAPQYVIAVHDLADDPSDKWHFNVNQTPTAFVWDSQTRTWSDGFTATPQKLAQLER